VTGSVKGSSADTAPSPRESRRLSLAAGCLASYAVVGGFVSLAGWLFDRVGLTDWARTGISIQPNACLAASASGLALGFLQAGRPRSSAVLSAGVALIGATVLFETLTGVDLGIDALLLFDRPWGHTGVTSPGRMGPAAATSWTLLGLALALVSLKRPPAGERIATWLGTATAGISLLGLVGYLYGASRLYSLPHSTVIAIQTASFIFAVSLGLILSVREYGPLRLVAGSNAGGVLARHALPVVLLVPLLVGFLRVIGERRGVYDSAFGSAARTLVEIALLLTLVAWAGRAVTRHEERRLQAERRSQASQLRVADTLESITAGFVLLDANWTVAYVNAEAERLLGRQRESLTHESLWTLRPELFATEINDKLRQAASERRGVAFESFKASESRWFAYKVHPTPDAMLAVYFEDVTARKSAERALSLSRQELEVELRDTRVLQTLSTELVVEDDSRRFYAKILEAAIDMLRADFGSMQLFHENRGTNGELELLVHRGFSDGAMHFWHWVSERSKTTSGWALQLGHRVVVPDIRASELVGGSDDAAMYETLGIAAAQSTPLVSRAGALLGMITTHWRAPHEPSSSALRLLDILARQAADWIERKRSAETIAALNARLAADLDALTRVHELSGPRTGDFSTLLRDLVGAAIAITNADMGTLQLLEGDSLTLAAQRGFEREVPEFLEVLAVDLSAGTGLLSKERVAIRDICDTPHVVGAAAIEAILAAGVRSIQATPLVNRSGEVLGVLSTHYRLPHQLSSRTLRMLDLLARQAADLIEQRQAERQRELLLEKERAARAEAERAARLKDEFLATLSHELRTPLNAVIGWSQILKNDISNQERVRTAVEVIERNGRQQARLITDLLDISRIVSGNMRLEIQAIDLPAVVDAAIDAVLPAAAARAIDIERSVEVIEQPLTGDPARLQQIVWNLLSNAVKFTPQGGSIRVVVARADANVEIRVTDSGDGIEPAFLPHVFERFRQADASAGRKHGGLGLGLAIVKQLAELHGGSVRASSDGRGHGATFTITLPLMSSERNETVAGPAHADHDGAQRGIEPALSGLRVLVVDDEPDALTMVRHLLEANEAAVGTAPSSQEALALLARERFDVIVSDIGMPGGDGYALIAELRTNGIDTPALALTAFARTEDRDRAIASGYNAHIAKPIDAEELVAAVARWGNRENPFGQATP
jgi:PAS domain S-box-containing protein